MWVFDATPLSYLAKVDRFEFIDELDEQCVLPALVSEEVVETGVEDGYPDARRIERGIDDDIIDVIEGADTPLRRRLQKNQNLSDADVAVLACADARDGIAVMEETYGRDVAATEGITTRGTAYLVLSLVEDGTIDTTAAQSVVDAMIDEGWYCAPDTYSKIRRKLESMGE